MKIKIGTRGSVLALKQADEARKAMKKESDVDIEIIKIKTSGDRIQNRSLVDVGGKGLFVKEIEQALIDKKIDIAVHSMKDLPGRIHEKLKIAGFLEREDPRDVFISNYYKNLNSVPCNGIIGTCAPRKTIQLRSGLQTKMLRGNITSRLEKAQNYDGIILALTGLKRLNIIDRITEIIPIDVMLPAVGQGVICLQCRKNDEHIMDIIDKITHLETKIRMRAERGFLIEVDGDCCTPLAAFAQIIKDELHIKAMLGIRNKPIFIKKIGCIDDAENIGKEAARELLLLSKRY